MSRQWKRSSIIINQHRNLVKWEPSKELCIFVLIIFTVSSEIALNSRWFSFHSKMCATLPSFRRKLQGVSRKLNLQRGRDGDTRKLCRKYYNHISSYYHHISTSPVQVEFVTYPYPHSPAELNSYMEIQTNKSDEHSNFCTLQSWCYWLNQPISSSISQRLQVRTQQRPDSLDRAKHYKEVDLGSTRWN